MKKDKVILKNCFEIEELQYICGIDIAYWEEDLKTIGVCSIVVIDYKNKNVIETKSFKEEINYPYVAGELAYRELPLIIKTYELLENKSDLAMFDGNGYLHPTHSGIATVASYDLNIPTIGVAKSCLKIDNVDFVMPENKQGSYEDILINEEIYGRTLRTRKDVKPVFVSCGNYIAIDTATKICMEFVTEESRIPMPTRLADIESRIQRRKLKSKEI